MSWTYQFKPSAAKRLGKMEATARQKIVGALERLTDELSQHGQPVQSKVAKLVGTSDTYRLRVDDWRVVFKFEGDRLVVLVLDVGHRREIYHR